MIIMWSLEFLALSTCEMFQFIKTKKYNKKGTQFIYIFLPGKREKIKQFIPFHFIFCSCWPAHN